MVGVCIARDDKNLGMAFTSRSLARSVSLTGVFIVRDGISINQEQDTSSDETSEALDGCKLFVLHATIKFLLSIKDFYLN